MFKKNSKFMDDLARMAGGTMGLFNNFREDLQNDIKERVDMMAEILDLIPLDEFERLEARVKKLEAELSAKAPAKKAGTKATKAKSKTTTAKPKKAAAKKTATKKADSKKKTDTKKTTKK